MFVILLICSGSVGIIGNGFTLIILCSSPRIRNKTVNIFLISQSLLDFLCAVFLIGTAWQVVWGQEGGHFEILGKIFSFLLSLQRVTLLAEFPFELDNKNLRVTNGFDQITHCCCRNLHEQYL